MVVEALFVVETNGNMLDVHQYGNGKSWQVHTMGYHAVAGRTLHALSLKCPRHSKWNSILTNSIRSNLYVLDLHIYMYICVFVYKHINNHRLINLLIIVRITWTYTN